MQWDVQGALVYEPHDVDVVSVAAIQPAGKHCREWRVCPLHSPALHACHSQRPAGLPAGLIRHILQKPCAVTCPCPCRCATSLALLLTGYKGTHWTTRLRSTR